MGESKGHLKSIQTVNAIYFLIMLELQILPERVEDIPIQGLKKL